MNKSIVLAAVLLGALASTAGAITTSNFNLKLTVEASTGHAWLSNTGTANVRLIAYSLMSTNQWYDPGTGTWHGYLNPGTDAYIDDDGNLVWEPGYWRSMHDSYVLDPAGTIAALTGGVTTMGSLGRDDKAIAEVIPGANTAFVQLKVGSAPWDIGYPLLPGKADLAEIRFTWLPYKPAGGYSDDCYGQLEIVTSILPGDANHDHLVDLQDFGILRANFGMTAAATWEQGDFNSDAHVDLQDFGILKAHYGQTAASMALPATAVPEPASLLAILAAAAGLIRRRRAP